MISAFLLSQILIGIAFITDVASFQFKKREITLTLFAISAVLISTHFFLLGAVTAGFVVAVSAVRFVVSIFSTSRYFMYFFLAIVLVLGMLTFDGYEDAFAISAMMFATISAFQANEKYLRQFMAVGTLLIIIHNVIIFTPAAIVLELFFLSSNVLSYWRFFIKKNTETS